VICISLLSIPPNELLEPVLLRDLNRVEDVLVVLYQSVYVVLVDIAWEGLNHWGRWQLIILKKLKLEILVVVIVLHYLLKVFIAFLKSEHPSDVLLYDCLSL